MTDTEYIALIGRFDDAATDYINAVTNYLDPQNQYTESRQRAMHAALSDLMDCIEEARRPAREAEYYVASKP